MPAARVEGSIAVRGDQLVIGELDSGDRLGIEDRGEAADRLGGAMGLLRLLVGEPEHMEELRRVLAVLERHVEPRPGLVGADVVDELADRLPTLLHRLRTDLKTRCHVDGHRSLPVFHASSEFYTRSRRSGRADALRFAAAVWAPSRCSAPRSAARPGSPSTKNSRRPRG